MSVVKHCVKIRSDSKYRRKHNTAIVTGLIPIKELTSQVPELRIQTLFWEGSQHASFSGILKKLLLYTAAASAITEKHQSWRAPAILSACIAGYPCAQNQIPNPFRIVAQRRIVTDCFICYCNTGHAKCLQHFIYRLYVPRYARQRHDTESWW